MNPPWEDPDWYDLHDTTWTAGPEREPEHYRELLLALPPLGPADHLLDVGAGTGKLSSLILRGYPEIGLVTLLEPNAAKLKRAVTRLKQVLTGGEVRTVCGGLGDESLGIEPKATIVVVGSVLMPIMELRGGRLRDGLAWVAQSLQQIRGWLCQGGSLYVLETLAPPWGQGTLHDPVRRLHAPELMEQIADAGFESIECMYRFRDRVVLRGRSPR